MRIVAMAVVIGLQVMACQFDASGVEPDATAQPDASVVDVVVDSAAPTEFRMASVNLRCLLDDWDMRVDALAEQLAAYSPSIVALQEVCRTDWQDSLAELKQRLETLTGRVYGVARADTHIAWDQYQEGIAVLVDGAVTDATIVDLPAGLFPRRAMIVRAPGVLFASTHLSFGDQQTARGAQMNTLLTTMRDARRGDETLVIAGDFNETPDGLVLTAALSAGFTDAWSALHPTDPGPTFPSSSPDVRIDFVLVSTGGNGLKPILAERFLQTPRQGIMPSDHLGLQVVLSN